MSVASLAVIETHPVQYHAPVYRTLQEQFGIHVTAIYSSDFSVAGYRDVEFDTTFRWDTDLLSGCESVFLSRVAEGGARTAEEVSTDGLKAALRRVNPAAVLLLGYSPRFHLRAFHTARRLKCPLLFRGETTDYARKRSALKRFVRDEFLRWFYARFAALLYVGRRSLEHFRRLGVPESRLFFSPYCVDTRAFQLERDQLLALRQRTRHELEISDGRRVLLFSGKLVVRKRPDLILQAVKGMSARVRESITVVFLGDGVLRSWLEKYACEEPPVDARFVGFQNQTALSWYYSCADLLILPSQSDETWGLVVNEAMHHGIPCVVSDRVGCAPDLIESGRTGEVFEAGNSASLQQAIERVLSLVGREDVRQWCQEKVSRYTVERAAEGIARAYQDVLERKGYKQ